MCLSGKKISYGALCLKLCFWEVNTLDNTEELLKDIREEIRKTNLTLGEMLKELKAYVVFRKAQKK